MWTGMSVSIEEKETEEKGASDVDGSKLWTIEGTIRPVT